MKKFKQGVKHSKQLLKNHTTSRRKLLSLGSQNEIKFFDEDDNELDFEYLKTLSQRHFNLQGAYPYLFDTIAHVITYHKKYITDAVKYYAIELTVDIFKAIALGPRKHYYQWNDLQHELINLMRGKDNYKVITSKNKVTLIQPLLIVINKDIKNKSRLNYKNKNKNYNQEWNTITIYFAKALFEDIVEKKQGMGWIALPSSMYAYFKYFSRYLGLPENYQKDKNAMAYDCLKIISYLSCQWNYDKSNPNFIQKKPSIIVDLLDLAKSCFPSLLDKDRVGIERLKYKNLLINLIHAATIIYAGTLIANPSNNVDLILHCDFNKKITGNLLTIDINDDPQNLVESISQYFENLFFDNLSCLKTINIR